MSEAMWVACAGFQAFTSPTAAMHMAELEQGMSPRTASSLPPDSK